MNDNERHCEFCHKKAKFILGTDIIGLAVCGTHYRYVYKRLSAPNKMTRTELRDALGFLFPSAPPFDAAREEKP